MLQGDMKSNLKPNTLAHATAFTITCLYWWYLAYFSTVWCLHQILCTGKYIQEQYSSGNNMQVK